MKVRRDWSKLLAQQEASGLSKKEFCRRQGVSLAGLYQYVSRQNRTETIQAKFVEAVVSDRACLLEIHGPKWSVKVPSHLPSIELTRIMRAITEAL